jgi:hypothetical protein
VGGGLQEHAGPQKEDLTREAIEGLKPFDPLRKHSSYALGTFVDDSEDAPALKMYRNWQWALRPSGAIQTDSTMVPMQAWYSCIKYPARLDAVSQSMQPTRASISIGGPRLQTIDAPS